MFLQRLTLHRPCAVQLLESSISFPSFRVHKVNSPDWALTEREQRTSHQFFELSNKIVFHWGLLSLQGNRSAATYLLYFSIVSLLRDGSFDFHSSFNDFPFFFFYWIDFLYKGDRIGVFEVFFTIFFKNRGSEWPAFLKQVQNQFLGYFYLMARVWSYQPRYGLDQHL